jgi:hypothetical protein
MRIENSIFDLTERELRIFKIFLKGRTINEASIEYNPKYERLIRARKVWHHPTVYLVFHKFKKLGWILSEKGHVEIERSKFGKVQTYPMLKNKFRINIGKLLCDFVELKRKLSKKEKKLLTAIFRDSSISDFIAVDYTRYSDFQSLHEFLRGLIKDFEFYYILGKQPEFSNITYIARALSFCYFHPKKFGKVWKYPEKMRKYLVDACENRYSKATFTEKIVYWSHFLPENVHSIFQDLLSYKEREQLIELSDIVEKAVQS